MKMNTRSFIPFCTGQIASSWGLRIFKPWFLNLWQKNLDILILAQFLCEKLCGMKKGVMKYTAICSEKDADCAPCLQKFSKYIS